MKEFEVTLAGLRKAGACISGYNKVVRSLQGRPFGECDEERDTYIRFAHKDPISIESILTSNGLDDALWALRCIGNADRNRNARRFGVWCARQVEHLMTDPRSKEALNAAERHADGLATDDELSAARAAAWDAARDAARDAAAWDSAAWDSAAWDSAAAAWDAARDAAWAAAWDSAAWDSAAWDSAAWGSAAWDSAKKEMFIKMLHGEAPWQIADTSVNNQPEN